MGDKGHAFPPDPLVPRVAVDPKTVLTVFSLVR
jgi:hypothetical protein